jgi:L-threonylcarbamoyladenylate synthase
MKTLLLRIDPKKPQPDRIRKGAAFLKKNDLVAFPTETVYGLGANALAPTAIRKIFKAKGRPSDNPLIVHIAKKKELFQLVENVPISALILIKKFWPGPLTIILKRSKAIPREISAGLDTVAVRLPKNKIARSLISAAGFPLAAPSANISGRPSPTAASHVMDDLRGKIACIIDGGTTQVGLESTVVDLTGKIPEILRPGKISLEEIRRTIGEVKLHRAALSDKEVATAKSPGMKYRHYAPRAELRILQGSPAAVRKRIRAIVQKLRSKKIAVLLTERTHFFSGARNVFLGSNSRQVAKKLFGALRKLDEKKIDLILIESLPEKGLGLAVMNRLKKAAGFNIEKV